MVFVLGPYRVDVDVENTQAFYARASAVAENCTCAGCRNYQSAVSFLPHQIRQFFDALGVKLEKACEVYVVCKNPDGTLQYGGFYHIRATLLAGGDQAFAVADSFQVSFHEDCALLDPDFPFPALQMEIFADIPWVLSERNEYD